MDVRYLCRTQHKEAKLIGCISVQIINVIGNIARSVEKDKHKAIQRSIRRAEELNKFERVSAGLIRVYFIDADLSLIHL